MDPKGKTKSLRELHNLGEVNCYGDTNSSAISWTAPGLAVEISRHYRRSKSDTPLEQYTYIAILEKTKYGYGGSKTTFGEPREFNTPEKRELLRSLLPVLNSLEEYRRYMRDNTVHEFDGIYFLPTELPRMIEEIRYHSEKED